MGWGMDEDWGIEAAEDDLRNEALEEIERKQKAMCITEGMRECRHPFKRKGLCVLCGADAAQRKALSTGEGD